MRAHPAYGLFPFNDWLQTNEGQWWELAYEYDYYDVFYFNEELGIGDYYWYNEQDELIAESDEEFYEYHYGDLIHVYNEDYISSLGYQWEASPVIGVDYYRYEKVWWIHGWASVMPFNKGLTDYSFKHKKGDMDYECGLIAG